MESIFPELQDSHLSFSNPFRFYRVKKGFCEIILKNLQKWNTFLNLDITQILIAQLNIGQFSKSQTFFKSSLHGLQDSGIGSWIWLRLRLVMKGYGYGTQPPGFSPHREYTCQWNGRTAEIFKTWANAFY